MRSVRSRCASVHVIFTCWPMWGFAISWFSICKSVPLFSTNTACPLFAVHSGSQVLRPLTFATHCESQMAPVFFIVLVWSAANSNAAEHRIPTNSHALRFIHASFARVHVRTLAAREFGVGSCFADGVHCLLLGMVNRVPDPKDSSTHSLSRDSRFGRPRPAYYIPIEGPLSSGSMLKCFNAQNERRIRRAKTCTCPTDPPAPRRRELPKR